MVNMLTPSNLRKYATDAYFMVCSCATSQTRRKSRYYSRLVQTAQELDQMIKTSKQSYDKAMRDASVLARGIHKVIGWFVKQKVPFYVQLTNDKEIVISARDRLKREIMQEGGGMLKQSAAILATGVALGALGMIVWNHASQPESVGSVELVVVDTSSPSLPEDITVTVNGGKESDSSGTGIASVDAGAAHQNIKR